MRLKAVGGYSSEDESNDYSNNDARERAGA
jgi:hypothetical protein